MSIYITPGLVVRRLLKIVLNLAIYGRGIRNSKDLQRRL